MKLAGKRVLVVGLGRSGIAAARLALSEGATVVGTDTRSADELHASVKDLDIGLVAGGHEGVEWEGLDLVVVSPGVPTFDDLERASRRGTPVVGELELASSYLDPGVPLLAVGGTNGKSTVTTLVRDLLARSGRRVFAGGNLGVPLSEAVGGQFDAFVVEVSSFQLERAPTFHPRVSVLLNVSEDHLDRYPSFQAYADAKGNAFMNQTPADVAIVPSGDTVCEAQARRGRGQRVTFGSGGDYEVTPDAVVERSTGETFSLARTELHGAHNRANAAAAIAAARAVTAPAEGIREGLSAFRSLGHRMTLVRDMDGVRYYDDSKATNVGAAVTALRGLSEAKAVLVAGGRDKLGSYEPLVAALREKGRALVVLGEAAEKIALSAGAVVPVVHATDMTGAVESARRLALEGDAVLLSPACSSFDMFSGYAERGDKFALAVRSLVPRSAS